MDLMYNSRCSDRRPLVDSFIIQRQNDHMTSISSVTWWTGQTITRLCNTLESCHLKDVITLKTSSPLEVFLCVNPIQS